MTSDTAPAARPARTARTARTARQAKRPSPATRRFGYLVALALNVALLVVIHVNPGWEAASFLTEDTADVLPLVTVSIALSILVNLVWLAYDPVWLRALGDLLTAVAGVVAAIPVLQVFPFTFPEGSLWPTVVRIALWVAIVGGAIGAVANLVALVSALRARPAA